MPGPQTLWITSLLIATMLSSILALLAWRYSSIPGRDPFPYLMLGTAVWALGHAMELGSASLPAKLVGLKVAYVGLVTTPVAWLFFALYNSSRKRPGLRHFLFLGVIPIVTLVLIWTNAPFRLLFRRISVDLDTPSNLLEPSPGPWFWVQTVYNLVLISQGSFLLTRAVVSRKEFTHVSQIRGEASVIIALTPWIGNVLSTLRIISLSYWDLTPLAFTVSGLIWMWQKREETLHRQAEGLVALHLNSLDITRPQDLSTLLQTIVERATGLLHATGGELYLCEPKTGTVRCIISHNLPQDHTGIVLPYGEGAAGIAAQTGDPLVIDDYHVWQGRAPTYTGSPPLGPVLSVPMSWQNQVVGVIQVLHLAGNRRFTETDLHLLTMFANQAAITVENVRLYEIEQMRSQVSSTLQEISRTINSTLDLDQVLRIILEQLKKVLEFDTAALMLIDQPKDELYIQEWTGYPADAEKVHLSLKEQQGITTHVALTGQPIYIPDTRQDPRYVDGGLSSSSEMAVPLKARGQIVGVLNVESAEPYAYDPQDLELLTAVANQASIAIENAQLFGQSRQRIAELETLQRTSLQLTSSLNLSNVLDTIAESALELVGANNCHIYLYEEATRTFTFGTALWKDGSRTAALQVPRPHGFTSHVAQDKKVMIIEDATNHPLYSSRDAKKWNIEAIAGFPLKRLDQVLGVFTITFLKPHIFTEDELRVLGLLADQAAIAIETVRLVKGLEKEVKARTAKIRAEQEKSEAILRSIGDAIIMTDPEMRIQYVNNAFTVLTGYTAQEAIGQSMPQLLKDLPEQETQLLHLAQSQAASWQGEISIRRKDGRSYKAALTINPMRDGEGRLQGYACSHQDISRIKELDRARSQFLANVSHQLRTPITNLKLYTRLLKERPGPEKFDHYLEIVAGQVDQLTHLVQDILEMTELDSGHALIDWASISPGAMIDAAIARYEAAAQNAGVALKAMPVPAELPSVKGDQDRLDQALNELLENAITFTPDGGEITIKAGTKIEQGQQWLTIAVSDTGVGISEEERRHVFDRFYRGNPVEAGHIPGTGLGLSIVAEIIHAHGGRIDVDSEVGKGSTFTLWLRGL